jgi:hypothetical protein
MRARKAPRAQKGQRRDPKSEATRANFVHKVELLESWVEAGGAPHGQVWPIGPVGLREWSDSALGIERWSSPNVATPGGRYADLRTRFDEAVEELKKLSLAGNTTDIRTRLQEAKSLNKILAAQVLTMRWQVRKLEGDLARAEEKLRLAGERKAALTTELAKVRPLRPLE